MLFVDQIEPQECLGRGQFFVAAHRVFQLLARGIALLDHKVLDGAFEFAEGLRAGEVMGGFGPGEFLAEQPVAEIQPRGPESRDHVDEIAHRIARDGIERMAPAVDPGHERHLLHHAVSEQSEIEQDDAPQETIRFEQGAHENTLVPRSERQPEPEEHVSDHAISGEIDAMHERRFAVAHQRVADGW